MPQLTCERAAAVLRGLEKGTLVVEAEEIEELMALGLAVEADPDDLVTVHWLQPVVREFAHADIGPFAIAALEEEIRKTDDQLKNDWYRMTTGKAERARREDDRIVMRRALALLRDKPLMERIHKLLTDAALLAPGAKYIACQELGSEVYALTRKGHRTRRSLKVRLERYANAPIKSFLAAFDKTETKMRTFGGEITALSRNIGYVKKNREQAVIGLAKAGVPAGHALGAYHAAMREVHAPDVAVTCARNAAAFGGPNYAAARLRYAQAALVRAGYPAHSPVAMGSAKCLLAFDPPDAGVPRFVDFMKQLQPIFGNVELLYKLTARLMPATGTPAEVIARVVAAGHLLNQNPTRVSTVHDNRSTGVALASMVKTKEALPELVTRFREIEAHLVQAGLSPPTMCEADALEAVGCPGTPAEVVDTIAVLSEQLAAGHTPTRSDVTVALAFAKRFAF